MPAEIRRDDCTDVKRMLWSNIALGVCVGLGGDCWQAPVALKPHHPPTTQPRAINSTSSSRIALLVLQRPPRGMHSSPIAVDHTIVVM